MAKESRAIVTCSPVLSDRINYKAAEREFREIEMFYTLYVTAKNRRRIPAEKENYKKSFARLKSIIFESKI